MDRRELIQRCIDSELRMPEVTAELRRTAAAKCDAPSFQAVNHIVNYLKGGEGVLYKDPTAVGEACGISADEVCDIVSSLGTFLGQSRRQAAGRAFRLHSQPNGTVGDIVSRSGAKPKGDLRMSEQVSLFPMHNGDHVALPLGWDRASTKRELDRAVANIVVADPDDEMIRRWMLRKWGNAAVSVTYELLASMWMFSRLGRITDIADIADMGDGNASLARAIADAWDMLDVSRRDAVTSIKNLCSGELTAEQVRAEIARCRWIAESDLLRVENAADACISNGVPSDHRLQSELTLLRAATASGVSRLTPDWVFQINAGQLRRLGETFGLDPDGDSKLRRKIVQIVDEYGLGADADRLVNLGVAAVRGGFIDLFHDALSSRAAGELEWASELHEALGVAP